jgi:hypothetical protein
MSGQMPASAREAVARAYEQILRRRYPGFSFSVPDEGPKAKTATRAGEVVGSLATPEDDRSIVDRDPAAPNEHGIETGLE